MLIFEAKGLSVRTPESNPPYVLVRLHTMAPDSDKRKMTSTVQETQLTLEDALELGSALVGYALTTKSLQAGKAARPEIVLDVMAILQKHGGKIPPLENETGMEEWDA